MQTTFMLLLLLVAGGLAGPFASRGAEAQSAANQYVCPPCACGKDDQVYDKPGFCSACQMELIVKGSAPPSAQEPLARKRVAILIFDGVQIIDYTGPYEVFGQAGLDVFTVAAGPQPITTSMGMKVTPHHSLADAPDADVLLIPGGDVGSTERDANVIAWIRERSSRAEYVVSVCNGAFILAKTGLLDGLTATTYYGLIEGLSATAPKVKVVKDRRYVDNGKYITTAGLSSGIDGSLYVISRLFGKARAQMTALNMEYDWKPDSTYARASLADRRIHRVFGVGLRIDAPPGARARVLSTEGTSRVWEVRWQIEGETSPAAVLALLGARLAGHWTEQKATDAAFERAWRFDDEDGGEWHGMAAARPAGAGLTVITLRVERTGASASLPPGSPAPTDTFVIGDAWIQEMPPSWRITSAHLVIENRSGSASALVGARTDVAGSVELHRMVADNGMMRMSKLDRIELPVGRTELTGDLHLMLMDLKRSVKEGDQVALTLDFANSVSKTILVPVRRRVDE
jgi:putative intracellular protease/amidase/copper(I)-binding protein